MLGFADGTNNDELPMPDWLTIFSPIAACAAMLMAFRLIFRERRLDHAKAVAERAAELEKAEATAKITGASRAELGHGMAELRAALINVTTEIHGMRTLAAEVLKVGIELAHVKAAVDDIRDEMKNLADAERVHATLDSLDRRMRDVEQHIAKMSGAFKSSVWGGPGGSGEKR